MQSARHGQRSVSTTPRLQMRPTNRGPDRGPETLCKRHSSAGMPGARAASQASADFFSSLFPKQYSVTTVRLGAMSNRVSGCGRCHGSTAPLHGRALSICRFRTLGGPRGHQGTTAITKSLTQ